MASSYDLDLRACTTVTVVDGDPVQEKEVAYLTELEAAQPDNLCY